MLFDTHAHMDDHAFDADRAELLAGLPEKGLTLVMNPGCSLESSRNAVALAREYDYIYAAVGSHPDVADEVNEEVLEEYRKLCKLNSKVKAIGEIGLDYHYEDIPREIQLKAFRMQMELARELNLPVIVHEREAHEDGMNVVREFPDVTGVFHCYSGSAEMARQLVDKGWYIGFTGVLTFKNARKAVEVAASIPLDRIVIETDCPYMAPDPFRGKRNDPGKIYRMAEKLAEIRGLSVEEIQAITVENGKRLYRIG
ncbi:MAG: TatD family hydrolase [Oscillospiraceae bacterium]|nr:TatD family hydrolase [Oscillospiraceae bacterium]